MTELYIGLMSGTSVDGVDGVLVDFAGPAPALQGHVHLGFEPALRRDLLGLNQSGADELHRAALCANALALCYAQATAQLLTHCATAASAVRAVGAHGQTVRHRPGDHDGIGYTLQLLNGALLAERCGIDVVCDLRSRDVAAKGQGAPLVPAFHAAVFGRPGQVQAVLNLGGIGNLTLLDGQGGVRGFDCGPGNALMDLWCERHLGQPYDADGAWAAGGRVLAPLLQRLAQEPFLQRPPPKSTGRDLFNGPWLDALLRGTDTAPAQDVQATLAEFTVLAAVQALRQHLPGCSSLLVCGGGALNKLLMARLAATLPGVRVASTAAAGVPPMQVEAAAFAWLARAFVLRQPGNLPAVTGAIGPRVLGALHPA